MALTIESSNDPTALNFHGGNRQIFETKDDIVVLVGSANSGKSFAVCVWLHLVLIKYPGTKVLMCRKSLPSLRNSAVKTFQQVLKMFGYQDKVRVLGETRPTNFIYPEDRQEWNGKVYEGVSEIIMSQIDETGKALGAEYDIVYVSQPDTENLQEPDFLQVASRARLTNCPLSGRCISDPNYTSTAHWLHTAFINKTWTFFESNHQDNPKLWDHEKNCWTEEGIKNLQRLGRLSQNQKESQLYGRWYSLSGTVFENEWKSSFVLTLASEEAQSLGLSEMDNNGEYVNIVPTYWDHYLAIDFGGTVANPFVALLIAHHPDTDQFIVHKHIYTGSHDIIQCAEMVRDMSLGYSIKGVVADRGRAETTIIEKYLQTDVQTAKKGNNSVIPSLNIVAAQLNEDKWRFISTFESLFHPPDKQLEEAKKAMGIAEELPNLHKDEKTGGVAKGSQDHAVDALRYYARWYAEEYGGYKRKEISPMWR